ncbi:neutral sphingomyelinase-like protein [Dinothrombium tinctorium]|uniref:Neutral sphingomyelinase-like protein n=1 Tax=Dinothrombium tinctorium TaxID=1965070 RepID=A0A3S3PVR5_9ACAR|nr:neutral sphingomyelinase-like protein [Dinothrombium tinctorium]
MVPHFVRGTMHAQYASNEQLDAQYSIHRICQAYQLGKFINLIGHSFTGNSNRDLLILAGDLNTDSNELPYRILVSMTNLTDSYGQYVNQGICDLDYDMNHKISAKYYIEDADLITCGHHRKDESGKRIDYIMYKLIQQHCDDISDSVKEHFCCLSDRVECHGKDVDAGLSFSDHQPVAIHCVDVENSKFTSGVGDGNDSKQRTLNELNEKSDSVAFRVCQVAESSESLACENVGNTLSESVVKVNATENLTITRSRIKRHSNVSLEIVENGRKAVGAIPPELKKTALSIVSKLYPKSDKSNGKEKKRPNSSHRENPYLRRAHQLLESYLAANMKSKRQSRIFFAFMMLILSWFVLLVAGLFSFIIMEIIYRFEQNAITGVFEDIDYMIDYTEYN